MTDRLQYLKYLQVPPENVTPSQFYSWKKSSITKALFKDLVIAIFDELDAPLPETFDQTIITAHQREGAMKMLDELIRWEPESVTKARAEGKLEEDNEN